MNAEIKAKWLDALRSGKYKQGTHTLQKNNCFCCLGVLCDIVEPEGWDEGVTDGMVLHDGVQDFPTDRFLEKVGLFADEAGTLAEMNDHGQSFAEIADYIEANL